MKRVSRSFAVGLALVAVALGLVVLGIVRVAGPFVALTPHFSGHCKQIALGASAEELELDPRHPLVYLSYLDRRGLADGKTLFGTVMLVDLAAPEPRPRAALTHDPPGFRPEGMSLYAPAGSPARLFVISHRPTPAAENVVEILQQSLSGPFGPLESVRDPLLVSPHAILAVGARAFYVANDGGANGAVSRFLDALLPRGRSTVVYYDGSSMHAVVTGVASGTGIAASPDGGHIYLSEGLAHRVSVYARDSATGALTLERKIELGSSPAAISVDSNGDLWVAAQPRALDLWRHLRDAAHRSPTQVFRISPRDWKPVEEFLDRGEQLSAGSSAVSLGSTLLIGAPREPKLLRCLRS